MESRRRVPGHDALVATNGGKGAAAPLPVRRHLHPPASWPPTLVVVVDTEEEFDWSAGFARDQTGVENIRHQPLAQAVFDRYGVVPAYAIDYPVATASTSVSVLGELAAEGRCEIGAHLHPWVNPPHEEPVDSRHSYPGNLGADLERRKLTELTEAITESFGIRPVIYKAGRYGIGSATPSILRDLGYGIDVSVVPHTDFLADGGPDFRDLPAQPFVIEPGICELPLSVGFVGLLARQGPALYRRLSGGSGLRRRLAGLCSRLGLLERLRLSPEGYDLNDMVRQTRAALAQGIRLFMLTYHSSSLLPGATPYVRSEAELNGFLAKLESYLSFFFTDCHGRADTVTSVAADLQSE